MNNETNLKKEISLNDKTDNCIYSDSNEVFISTDDEASNEESESSQTNYELNTKNKTLNCNICGKIYARQVNMVKHKMIVHNLFLNTMDEINKDVNIKESKGKWTCNICKQSFTRRGKLINHRVTEHNLDVKLELRCRWCGQHFNTLNGCAQHENKIHNANGPVVQHKCKWCNRTFTRREFCLRHEKEKHDSNGNKINERKYKKRTEKKRHICEICGNMYAQPSKLIEHIRTHTGERPLICDLCGKTFAKKQHLHAHKLHHLDVRPFKCDYCDKGFYEKSKLRIHEMIHTGTYEAKCNICDKLFRTASMLNVHRKLHCYINNTTN